MTNFFPFSMNIYTPLFLWIGLFMDIYFLAMSKLIYHNSSLWLLNMVSEWDVLRLNLKKQRGYQGFHVTMWPTMF